MTPTEVDVYRRRRARHVLFQRVPALVCEFCGCRVFEAAAVERMEFALTQSKESRRTTKLEIISGLSRREA